MDLVTLRLPPELARAVDQLAESRHVTRSDLVREAIEQFVAAASRGERGDRLTLLGQLVTYAGSGKGDLASRSAEYLRKAFREKRRRRTR